MTDELLTDLERWNANQRETILQFQALNKHLLSVNAELLAALTKLYKDRSGRVDAEVREAIAKAEDCQND